MLGQRVGKQEKDATDLKLWLSRQRDGKYLLTKRKPVLATVEGVGKQDFYVAPGDPVGYRNMCAEVTPQVLGAGFKMRRLTEPYASN